MAVNIVQHTGIASDSQSGCQQKQPGNFCKVRQYLVADGLYQFVNPESGKDKQEIVGNLWMIHPDLNRSKDAGKRRSHPHVSSKRIIDCPEQHGCESQGEHFGDMPCPDDDKEVG